MKRVKVFWSLFLSLALAATMLIPIPALAAPAMPTAKAPFFFAGGAGKGTASQTWQFVPGEIIVKYKSDASLPSKLPSIANARKVRDLGSTGAQLLSVPKDRLDDTIAGLRASGQVEYATPNYLLHIAGATSGDTLLARQWALNNTGQLIPDIVSGTLVAGRSGVDIDLPDASGGRSSSRQVLVGLIDTGVDINHPDLQDSIWTNPRPGQYGYDGDVHGWNFVDNSGDIFDSSFPIADAHGTHIAGIIAAKTQNRFGVTGAATNAKIVVLKFIGPDGSGTLSNAILAIDYASKVGVKVINASWGGFFPLSPDDPYYDPGLQSLGDAIQASHILFVTSSGNTYDGAPIDLDSLPDQGYQYYPAGFRFPNVITVAAVNNRGSLCKLQTDGFNANVGDNTVDIAAPGSDIVSSFTMDPNWGVSVEGKVYNARTACWGFGIQDIDGRSNRAELLRRELLFLRQQNGRPGLNDKPDVLLVDDDNSQAGFPDCNRYWKEALDGLRLKYKVVRVPASTGAASDGPSLDEMSPFQTVIWQTGRDGENDPLLTARDEDSLAAYVNQGGSLLLSGERAIDENPAWSAQVLQAQALQLGTPLPFFNYSGLYGSSYDGFNCIADGADFGSLPILFDLLVPAGQGTSWGGLTPRYAFDSGTSMSAGYVSAVAALLYGKYPQVSAETARQLLMGSAKPLAGLAGLVGSGGMVDAAAALKLPSPSSSPPGPGAYQEDYPRIFYYGNWKSANNQQASGGHYRTTTSRGACALFVFTGKGIAWNGLAGPDQGIARVWIDGRPAAMIDAYSASPQFTELFAADNLKSGLHSIFIQNTGRANAAGTRRPAISLDLLTVQ